MLAKVDGGLLCQQYELLVNLVTFARANGVECVVKDFDHSSAVSFGSIITVKHSGVTSTGKLINPTYWRLKDTVQEKQVILVTTLLLMIL